jgi:hypothetical protein
MLDTFTPDPVALSLASRLKAAPGQLSAKWFDLVADGRWLAVASSARFDSTRGDFYRRDRGTPVRASC